VSARTLESVTVGGWYENDDGTVTEYTWRAGRLCTGETASSWTEVSEIDSRREQANADYERSRGAS
jgi:hypothetical protein